MTDEKRWIYQIGGVAAIAAVLVGIAEIAITYLPGGYTTQESVLDWFNLYQQNPFMGLRNLGLLNIFFNFCAVMIYFALNEVHKETPYRAHATFVMLVALLGVGVFLSTNRAFAMLDLSNQYAAATTETQQSILLSTGQAMLAVGQSHTPGTFLSFFLAEAAGILISLVMLRSGVFSKITAYLGILGFSMLLIFEYSSTFLTGLGTTAMILAMIGGPLSMAFNILVAVRLFRIAKKEKA
jgi:hypothetical protein